MAVAVDIRSPSRHTVRPGHGQQEEKEAGESDEHGRIVSRG
jgi:hypothetical protein